MVNMSVLINDNYMVFNHLDAYHSCMLGHGYFAIPDSLIKKMWIRVKVLFPSFISLTCTSIHVYVKNFPGVVWYWVPGIHCCCD